MAYLGNGPGVASQRVTDTFSVSTTTTTFTPSAGYTVGYLDVFHNGVKLVNGDDYTASNGTTFVLATAANNGDTVECVAYIPRGLSDGYTKAEADAKYPTKANNLSDLASASTARTNLGLGSLATVSPTGTPNGSKFLRDDNTWQIVSVTPTAVSGQANTATDYFALPSGTTAQRPASPVNGMVRYNTSLNSNEIYQNGAWQSFSFAYNVEYLIVAGGGSTKSGSYATGSGGGGAGGALDSSTTVYAGTNYSFVIGAGGTGVSGAGNGNNGSNSTGFSQTAIGGGVGAAYNGYAAGNGGSGGGGGYAPTASGSGTSGQGYAGGTGLGSVDRGGGGGGGAGGAGGNATGSGSSTVAGSGGIGINWKSLGTYYAGGGGGAVAPWDEGGKTAGAGGAGGGGAGARSATKVFTAGTAGTANTGGGAGGSSVNGPDPSNDYLAGANGGSGVIVLRYLGSQKGSGGTVTSSGGYTYHTFTSSGTFTA